MPGRQYSSSSDYRYGFNGKMNDKDWGSQLIQDYGFRLYNPSIGKFLSVDPLAPKYPWNSTYAFAENSPIENIDLDGLEKTTARYLETEMMVNSDGGGQNKVFYVNTPDGETGQFVGSKNLTQAQAQSQYNSGLVNKAGWINDALPGTGTVVRKHIPKLENKSRKEIVAIMLHRTVSTTVGSSLDRAKKEGVGTHFYVTKDGKIIQAASVYQWTPHVGKIKSKCMENGTCDESETKIYKKMGWNPKKVHLREIEKEYPARYPYNKDAIGIEVVGDFNAKTQKWEPLTGLQVEAVSTLVNLLQTHFELTDVDVYTHEEVSYKQSGEGQVVKDAIMGKVAEKRGDNE